MDLVKLHASDGLKAVAFTAADEEDLFLSKARELGVEYSIGSVNWRGEDSPYLNLNQTPGPTYVFVVGRTGGVLWRGDHGTKTEEFLEAVQAALAEPIAPGLPATVPPALADAARLYVERDYAKAGAAAEKVRAKHGKKKGPEAEAVAAEASALAELVAKHLAGITQELERAWSDADAEAIARAHRALLADFPKSGEAKDAAKRLSGAKPEADLHSAIQAWLAWLELAETRPALFPARRGKAEKRFASKLESYLKKNADGPGSETATRWLETWKAK